MSNHNAQKILVVGSINHDMIFTDTIEDGNNFDGMIFNRIQHGNGGKGVNSATTLKKIGTEVSLCGCVGNDEYGKEQLDGLKNLGIGAKWVRVLDGVSTGLSVMLTKKDGTYGGGCCIGANYSLSPEIVEETLSNEDFDMILMQMEIPLETVFRTYELASKHEIPVILDLGPAKKFDMDRLTGIYMISPNEAETECMTGIAVKNETDALAASKILYGRCTPKYVVLKLGGKGAYLFDGKDGRMFPPFAVNAVDSTGAGDTFTAALAAKLCEGEPIEEAIVYANAAGAICVSRVGGQSSVPSKEEIEQFLLTRK